MSRREPDADSDTALRRIGLLGLVVLALLLVVVWRVRQPRESSRSPREAPQSSEPGAAPLSETRRETRPLPGDAAPPQVVRTTRWWRPGQEHWYGNDKDPFIRQPQDYDETTPQILGNRISYHVFDLERVQDIVRRGMDHGAEIARARGTPLSAEEREAGRRVIQAFFDETVPDVDAVVSGDLSQDDAYAAIGPRRRRMNRDLREALHLTDEQFYVIWPHIRELEQNLDQLREPDPR